MEMLGQIDAGYFCAGFTAREGKVIWAAPIIGYMQKQGWSLTRVRDYCATKRWKLTVWTPTKT